MSSAPTTPGLDETPKASAPSNWSVALPRTIQDEIDAYKAMTDDDKKLIRAMFNALVDLRCPNCHERVSVTLEL